MNVIEVVLKIKSPVENMDELDLTKKVDEILEAIFVFNDKFRDWSKRLILTSTTKKAFHLLLVIEKTTLAENISVREMRYFIQYLRNKKGWISYTREKNKMFKTIEFNRLDRNQVVSFIKRVMVNKELYEAQKQDVDFINETETLETLAENKPNEMNDDELLAVFNYLLKTRKIGPDSNRKTDDCKKIIEILNKWI